MDVKYITWKMMEQNKFREKIKDCTDRMTEEQRKFLRDLFEYIKARGAIREDVLELFLQFPMKSQNQVEAVLELLKQNAEYEWFQFVQDISGREIEENTKECMYGELIYANRNHFPEEMMKECLENSRNAFEMRMEEEKYREEYEKINEEEMMKHLEEVTQTVAQVSKEIKVCEKAKEDIVKKINEATENSGKKGRVEELEKLEKEKQRLQNELTFYKQNLSEKEKENAALKKECITMRAKYQNATKKEVTREETDQKEREEILNMFRTIQAGMQKMEQILMEAVVRKEEQKEGIKETEETEETKETEQTEEREEIEETEETKEAETVRDVEETTGMEDEKVTFFVKLLERLKIQHLQKLEAEN